MIRAQDLKPADAHQLIKQLVRILYFDMGVGIDDKDRYFMNPDKNWDSEVMCEVAELVAGYDLAPEHEIEISKEEALEI